MKSGKIIVTTSWDDGHPLDIKLCNILKEMKIEGTIYTPLTNHENIVMSEDQIRTISQNFEIGGHTYNHTVLTKIFDEQIQNELINSKSILEKITKKNIVSFCYPLGKYNKHVIEHVKNAGYKCGRTAELFRTSFHNNYEMHTTLQTTDRILLSKIKQIVCANNPGMVGILLFRGNILKKWNVIAKETFDYIIKSGGVWHLWGHSWEIEMNKEWDLLKDLLEYVSTKGRQHGAEFLTNGDLIH